MGQIKKRIIYLLLAISIVASAISLETGAAAPDKMQVHFIDVGQGDSTLIQCGDKSMLIDAGDDSKGTAIQNYLQKQGIKKLDYLVLTHPDSDHIGGAPVIITKFDIGKVFMSDFEKDSRSYQKLIEALDYKRLKASTPPAGRTYRLGTAVITILGPVKTYDDPNNSSIALMAQNGRNKFLFTGDAEETAENDMAGTDAGLKADVYHVGHHGSKTSTSEAFFNKVNPTYAVISCGEGNPHGHPNALTLNTLRAAGVKVYRTDEEGTIIATSDGTRISFDVPASETWKAGEPTGPSAESTKKETAATAAETTQAAEPPVSKEITYVLNTKTKKFHRPTCRNLPTKYRKDSSESRSSILSNGYSPCKNCKP